MGRRGQRRLKDWAVWSVIPGLMCERKRISRRTSSFTSTRSRGKETQALSEALSWFQPRSPTESERHPWGLGWAPTKQPREQGGQMRNGSFQGEGPGQPTGQSKSQALRAPAGNKGALRAGDPAASPRDPEDSPWQGAAPAPKAPSASQEAAAQTRARGLAWKWRLCRCPRVSR